MVDYPTMEIPPAMREMAEQNMKQAHAAYEQLTDFVTHAMDNLMGAMPENSRVRRLQRCPDPSHGLREGKCRHGFQLRREGLQCTNLAGNFGASDAIRSRPDEGLYLTHAGTLRPDRGGFPKDTTRLMVPSGRSSGQMKKKAANYVQRLEKSREEPRRLDYGYDLQRKTIFFRWEKVEFS